MERLRIARNLGKHTFVKFLYIGQKKYALHLLDSVNFICHKDDPQIIYLMADTLLFLELTDFEVLR